MSPAVFTPRPYQARALDFARQRSRCALWLDMGLGKSVVALTLAREWLESFACSRILIVAPKRVAREQWPREISKWSHTATLDYVLVAGTPKQRREQLAQDVSIVVIGRDNLAWLAEELGEERFNFDGLIYDESSGLKDPSSARFKLLRRFAGHFTKVLELTGTPAPNSLEELWPQLYLLDAGKRLGRTITAYREAYFRKPWSGYGYEVVPECREIIHKKVADICLHMRAADYLDLEPITIVDRHVVPSRKFQADYKRLAKDYYLELADEDGAIKAVNEGVLFGKLLQMAGGAVYDEDKVVHRLGDDKLDTLGEILEGLNEPVLIAYGFQHERDRILERFPQAVSIDTPHAVSRWNAGELPILLCHPASAGHGLNLQDGGRHIIWYGQTTSLELYQQFNARLQRSGQTKPVIVTRLLTSGTIDEDVVSRILAGKYQRQGDLLDAVRASHNLPTPKRAA